MSKVTSTATQPQTQVPHDKIAKRAYEKWCQRGQPHGTEKQDWLEAEAELRAEQGRPAASPQQRRM